MCVTRLQVWRHLARLISGPGVQLSESILKVLTSGSTDTTFTYISLYRLVQYSLMTLHNMQKYVYVTQENKCILHGRQLSVWCSIMFLHFLVMNKVLSLHWMARLHQKSIFEVNNMTFLAVTRIWGSLFRAHWPDSSRISWQAQQSPTCPPPLATSRSRAESWTWSSPRWHSLAGCCTPSAVPTWATPEKELHKVANYLVKN